MGASADFDVLIIGAGASGVGVAAMLTETFGVDKSRVMLLERGTVGQSFRKWPAETRFISPSFNQQGWTNSFDLNSIFRGTSPAYSLHSEHPTGANYAKYLASLAHTLKLRIRTQTEVRSIRPSAKAKKHPLFEVDVSWVAQPPGGSDKEELMSVEETLTARYVVWAAGEFQYPKGASASSTNFGRGSPSLRQKFVRALGSTPEQPLPNAGRPTCISTTYPAVLVTPAAMCVKTNMGIIVCDCISL